MLVTAMRRQAPPASPTPEQAAVVGPTHPAGLTDEKIEKTATTPPQLRPIDLSSSAVSASGQAATGVDSKGNPISYAPQQIIDGRPDTTWRVAGDGVGEWLQIDFASEVLIEQIGVIPGYAKIDSATGEDRFTQNRAIQIARFEFSDGSSVRASFLQDRRMQVVPIGGVRTRSLRIVIEASFPPQPTPPLEPREFTPISEVQVWGAP